MKMHPKTQPTLIFDFDGTIADSWAVLFDLYRKNSLAWGFPTIAQKDLAKLRKMSAREIAQKYSISNYRLLTLTYKMQKLFFEHIQKVALVDGIKDVLDLLVQKKIKLGIVSSNEAVIIEHFCKKNDIQFDFIYGQKSIFGKSRLLKKAIKNHNLNPELVFYVGDEVRDIQASRKAFVNAVAVTWGFNDQEALLEANPDFIVDSPKDLLNLI